MWDLCQVFGSYPLDADMVNGMKPEVWNKKHQVFPSQVSQVPQKQGF